MQHLRKEELIPGVHTIKKEMKKEVQHLRKEKTSIIPDVHLRENFCTIFLILQSAQRCNNTDQNGIILYFLAQANRTKQKHSDCQK